MSHSPLMIFVLSALTIAAQDINLTGEVTSSASGLPLKGAIVTLSGEPQLIDTTGADGIYHLSTVGVVHGLPGEISFSGNRLKNGRLEISVGEREPVTVETYRLNGVLHARLLHEMMFPGFYKVDIRGPCSNAGILLVKVRMGNKTTIYPFLPLRSSFTNSTPEGARSGGLMKTTVFEDTLICTLSGFTTEKKAITASTGANDIALVPLADTAACTGTPPPGMKCIKGGTFTMGSGDSSDYDASPPHQVTVSTFFMDSTDVTQSQYQAITGTNPASFDSGAAAPLRPVENVSWFDAVLYCNAVSKSAGLDTCYSYTVQGAKDAVGDFTKNGYRLPTEAQWEYACRAGTTTAYYWGDNINGNYCWYYGNSGATTRPVATKLPNAWGLYDMSGNIWQWCNDSYASYSSASQTDPAMPPGGSYRVVRGGCWTGGNNEQQRCAYRYYNYAVLRFYLYGFRCVRRYR